MANEIIAAVFDTEYHANEARRAVEAGGIQAEAIRQYSQNDPAIQQYLAEGQTVHQQAQQPEGAQIQSSPITGGETHGFWASLFGGSSTAVDHAVYERSLSAGSNVLTISLDAVDAPRVTTILENFSPVDLDERAGNYGLLSAATRTEAASPVAALATAPAVTTVAEGETAITPVTAQGIGEGVRETAATGNETIALHEEQLQVGTRQISGNTTRIRRYTVTTPVEQQVTLHDETVTIERTKPVNDVVTGDAFAEKTIEVTTTTEEPVVAKVIKLAEEIVVHRETTERVETVADTVRHEEVEVQQIPAADTVINTASTAPAEASAPIEMKQGNG